MSKRELENLSSAVDVDAPRAKRRKEAPPAHDDKQDVKPAVPPAHKGKEESREAEADSEKHERVKEQGLQLWQTLKDAVDKDGRALAHDFHRLPSKRVYPDYYELIKKPIALDDIKSNLESGAYATIEDAKNDFELCFRNAKRYNQKESPIWMDAKALHKLVAAEYKRLVGAKDGEVQADDDEGSGDEGSPKKKKQSSLTRLLTIRLDKLIAVKDSQGQSLADPFMELPARKQWAIYYKTIQKPICFEKIYKHLKRKEYYNSATFAADVELVFSNALQFNEDHTPIWEAAQTLKKHFHKFMSDLPEPYALPQYAPAKESSGPSNGKIRLKVTAPGASSSAAPAAKPGKGASSSPVMLRVPAANNTAPAAVPASSSTHPTPATTVPTPAAAGSSSPATQAQATPAAARPTPQLAQPHNAQSGTSQPTPARNGSTPVLPAVARASTQSMSNSPAPVNPRAQHPLRSVTLTVKPVGRQLELDHRDGVKTWALRLGPGEQGMRIANVLYLGVEEEESSSDEEPMDEEEEEEEEAPKKGKGKGKGKAATGKRKNGGVRIKDGVKLPPKHLPPQLQVKLDASALTPVNEDEEEWDVELPVGSHVLELGEKGGLAWKVYVDRIG
ncbi:Bromodomain-containing protein [Dentipellis sp. KUC8613]|nr:Bromodomain-containing protein [Dentipellis sp. KUC8613]